jgi:hypothetical protein
LLSLFAALVCFAMVTSHTSAASSATFTGGGWTLTLSYHQAAYGQTMSGMFRSARQAFQVSGDWIPAADQGSDLLRFYGHPFGPKSPLGLVGVATLGNTCTPSCVASKHYQLQELSGLATLPNKLPGVGQPSLLVQLRT